MNQYPGYQGQPGGYPTMPGTPPEQKKSRKGLWITLGVIGGLLVLCCAAGIGLFVFATVQAAKPIAAATNFCDDLKAQDYTAAYGMLSTDYQGKVTADQFTQASQLHDQIDGKVKKCGLLASGNSSTSFNFDFNNNTAKLSAQTTRNKTFTGTIALVKQGDDWKIDNIDPSLQGTDLGPLQVANDFCKALAAANYTGAYADLSTKQHSEATEAQFEASIKAGLTAAQKQAGTAVTIAGCKPDLTSYAVSSNGTTASLNSQLLIAAGAVQVPVAQKVSFVKESGAWKIDDLVNTGA
ncbi:MAG TPA: NTF2-like N-terminal transpeptidase domain-containing protein [Ktedonobacterales bacterium]